jgi:hypothetical protein
MLPHAAGMALISGNELLPVSQAVQHILEGTGFNGIRHQRLGGTKWKRSSRHTG